MIAATAKEKEPHPNRPQQLATHTYRLPLHAHLSCPNTTYISTEVALCLGRGQTVVKHVVAIAISEGIPCGRKMEAGIPREGGGVKDGIVHDAEAAGRNALVASPKSSDRSAGGIAYLCPG